jgi:GNAT superfamily N-acetyltransferase
MASPEIPHYYDRLRLAFPGPEIKALHHLEALRRTEADHPLRYVQYESEEAVMFSVEGEQFIFVDYIAVDHARRGCGTGTKLISSLIEQAQARGKFLLLEVDIPVSEADQKRIAFYERLGLRLYPEVQYNRLWSYDPSSSPCQMLLMANNDVPPDAVREAMRQVYLHIHSWRMAEFYGREPPPDGLILPSN